PTRASPNSSRPRSGRRRWGNQERRRYNDGTLSEEIRCMAEQGIATHSPEGVDLTLIRWMLSLTPEERLRALQANVQAILRLRDEATSS
ncbi:MAG: hypothetical protein V3U86_00100, partial [Acidobacteriota bacterium]